MKTITAPSVSLNEDQEFYGLSVSVVLGVEDVDVAKVKVNTSKEPFPVIRLGELTLLGPDLAAGLRGLADRVDDVMVPYLPAVVDAA